MSNQVVYEYNTTTGTSKKTVVDPSFLKHTTTYEHDRNRLTKRFDANANKAGDSTPTESYTFDAYDNILTSQDYKGTKKYTYNENHDVVSFTDREGKIYTNTYDGVNLTSSTDPQKVTDAQIYDPYGNVVASSKNLGTAENLVQDFGMEKSTGSLSVTGWVRDGYNNNGTVATDIDNSLSGQAVKVSSSATSTTSGYILAYQDMVVLPNTEYRLTAKVKKTGGNAYFNTLQMKSDGSAISTSPYIAGGYSSQNNIWEERNLEFKTAMDAAKIRIYLQIGNSSVTTSTAWWDSVQLINKAKGSAPASWLAPTQYNDVGTVTVDPAEKVWGNQAVRLLTSSEATTWGYNTLTQEVTVQPNTSYTFSAMIKSKDLQGARAFLNVQKYNADPNDLWADNRYSAVTGTSDWTRRQVSFKTGPNTTKVLLYLQVDHEGKSSGMAWYDNVQLEKGAVSTEFNGFINSSFEQSYASWSTWYSNIGTIDTSEKFEGSKSLKITRPSGGGMAHLYQIIPINQTEAKPITVSGMSKASGLTNSVINAPNDGYAIKVQGVYEDGTSTSGHARFALGTHDWQRAAVVVKPESQKKIQYVLVHLFVAGDNYGTAWFDNIRIQDGSSLSSFVYDSNNNFVTSSTDPLSYTTTSYYDILGREKTKTDAKGNVTTYSHHRSGKFSSILLPDDDGAAPDVSLKVHYTYDDNGNIVEKKLMNKDNTVTHNVTSYTFDAADQLLSTTDPLGRVIRNEYDANGNLIKVINPDGKTKEMTYGADNRLTEIRYNGIARYRFEYDANGNETKGESLSPPSLKTRTFDKANRMTAMATEGGTIQWSYDGTDNLKEKKIVSKDNTATYGFQYSFNQADRNTVVVDPSGLKYRFDYDESGNVVNYASGNDTMATFVYNDNDWLTDLVVAKGGTAATPIASYKYTYDQNGNRTSVTDLQGKKINYTYDALNQLRSETDPMSTNRFEYRYDARGNRISKSMLSSTGATLASTTYTYDAANQLTGIDGAPLVYDANGNLIEEGNKQYVWDTNGRLIQVKLKGLLTPIAVYQYDEDNRRIRSTVNNVETNYVYDGDSIRVLYETNALNEITRYYTYNESGQLLSVTEVGIATYYYHYNAHGDVIAVTDRNGTLVAEYTYDAWGNILSQSGAYAEKNPYRYAGYRYDRETGFYYLTARYYNPSNGQFMSLDPDPGDEDDPKTQNGYNYANNNPVMGVDPDGHWVWFAVNALFIGYELYSAYKSYRSGGDWKSAASMAAMGVLGGSKIKAARHAVYGLYDEANMLRYVGRTSNVQATVYRHGRSADKGHLQLRELKTDLTYDEARGLEHRYYLKNKSGGLLNKIRPISKNNPSYHKYMKASRIRWSK